MGVVEQAIHGGAGEERVAEESVQLVDGAVGGQQGGGVLVALADDLVEVDGFVAREGAQAEVVEDEKVGGGEAEHAALVAAVCAGGAELLEQVLGSDVEDGVPGAAGAVAQGLGDASCRSPSGR